MKGFSMTVDLTESRALSKPFTAVGPVEVSPGALRGIATGFQMRLVLEYEDDQAIATWCPHTDAPIRVDGIAFGVPSSQVATDLEVARVAAEYLWGPLFETRADAETAGRVLGSWVTIWERVTWRSAEMTVFVEESFCEGGCVLWLPIGDGNEKCTRCGRVRNHEEQG